MLLNRQLARRVLQTEDLPANTIPRPTVTGCSPASGPAAGGTLVVVNGSGFKHPGGDAFAVAFGGTYADAVNVLSDSQIQVATPAHAAGAVAVRAFGPGGQGVKDSVFTYV